MSYWINFDYIFYMSNLGFLLRQLSQLLHTSLQSKVFPFLVICANRKYSNYQLAILFSWPSYKKIALNICKNSSCMTTYYPSWKLSKLDKPDIQDTAGEVEMSSQVIFSCGPLHMDKQRQDDQLEPTYGSSVLIRDVGLKTYQKQWTIGRGGERGSRISVLIARHDDDNDM